MSKPVMEKFLNGEKLTEGDRANLAWGDIVDEGYEYVDQIDGPSGRWTQKMQTVFKYNGEYWAIDWYSGLLRLHLISSTLYFMNNKINLLIVDIAIIS